MDKKQEYSILMRMAVIGHSGVGKTSLVTRFLTKKYDKNVEKTE